MSSPPAGLPPHCFSEAAAQGRRLQQSHCVCRSQQQHIQPSPLPCHPARQGSDGVLKFMNMLIFNGSVKLTHYTSMSAPPILKSVTPAANMVALTITDCRWRGVDASDGDGSVGRGGCVRCHHRGSRVWARWPACSRRSGHLGIACVLSDAPSSPCAPCRWRWRSRQRPRSPWSGSTLRPSCGQASAQHSSAAARPAGISAAILHNAERGMRLLAQLATLLRQRRRTDRSPCLQPVRTCLAQPLSPGR